MKISELFGPTCQGEGPSCGTGNTYFVRLGLCNLDCTWCDTPFTWDWSRFTRSDELTDMSVREVSASVPDSARLVVISGGEPLVQLREVAELCRVLLDRGIPVEIETNGTRHPSHAGDKIPDEVRFNVSPKLAHAQTTRNPISLPALRALAARDSTFKFVCQVDMDVEQAARIAQAIYLPPERVWIMPEGQTADRLAVTSRNVADYAIRHGFNISPRLHVNLWGNTRGH